MTNTAIYIFFQKSRHILIYSGFLATFIFLLNWLQWKFLIIGHSTEIYGGFLALFFTGLGIWIASQLIQPKIEKVVVEKKIIIRERTPSSINHNQIQLLKLTKRELEVLQLMAKGYRNVDIAKNLFLSVSTIKSHVSSLLAKMDVQNRVQAIKKAKDFRIIN